MGVLTAQEYAERKRRREQPAPVVPIQPEPQHDTPISFSAMTPAPEATPQTRDILMTEKVQVIVHPNGEGYFEDILTLDDGLNHPRKVVGGLLKTRDKILADFLIKKGWILLEEV